ncbi:hypothetical protein EYF80_048883 [Liparis tanakae]|uniref:Uncharacterized protein n=1 Tax=Liparis tanakae TaxID=230148 RepID=A0A4Z2FJ29_9TELE|nr:hypothetical protein EYF80_048883 [Liparis tanakae]
MAPLIVLCVDQSLEGSPPSHLRKSSSPAANRTSSSSWRLAAVARCTAAVCRFTLSARRSSLLIPPRGSFALVRSAAPPWLHFPGEKATGGRTGVLVHEDTHRGTHALPSSGLYWYFLSSSPYPLTYLNPSYLQCVKHPAQCFPGGLEVPLANAGLDGHVAPHDEAPPFQEGL